MAFLDSLWSPASEYHQHLVVKQLRQYLECEWGVCGAVGQFQPERVQVKGQLQVDESCQAVTVDVPQQTNDFDCGIYAWGLALRLLVGLIRPEVLEFVHLGWPEWLFVGRSQLLQQPWRLLALGRQTLKLQVRAFACHSGAAGGRVAAAALATCCDEAEGGGCG